MKRLITILFIGIFVIVGCEDNPVSSDNEVNTFVTEGLTNYFSFETISGDTTGTSTWDIAFTAQSWSPAPGAPVIWDPYLISNDNITVARVEAVELSDVVDVPLEELFTDNFTTLDDAWYETDENHIVHSLDYVYIVNSDDGKYPAFEVVNYYDDEGNSGVFTIEWKYLAE